MTLLAAAQPHSIAWVLAHQQPGIYGRLVPVVAVTLMVVWLLDKAARPDPVKDAEFQADIAEDEAELAEDERELRRRERAEPEPTTGPLAIKLTPKTLEYSGQVYRRSTTEAE